MKSEIDKAEMSINEARSCSNLSAVYEQFVLVTVVKPTGVRTYFKSIRIE